MLQEQFDKSVITSKVCLAMFNRNPNDFWHLIRTTDDVFD